MSKHSSKRRATVTVRKTSASPPARRASSPSAWLAPAAIVLAALIIRLIVLVQLGGDPLLQPRGVLDDAAYVRMATRVAAGDLALAPDVYYLAPLYTYFLGLVFAVTGGSLQAARLVQVALGVGTVALVMATARAWWSRGAALAAGALAAATGLLAFNEILILQSSVDAFLTAVALFALAHAVRSPSWGRLVVAGAALGALAANRPNALPVVAVVALLWVVVHRSRAAAAQAVALGLGTLLVLAPLRSATASSPGNGCSSRRTAASITTSATTPSLTARGGRRPGSARRSRGRRTMFAVWRRRRSAGP